ncbi:hypothetical protein DYB25_002210 [Aphanomyces astaci]|uniref:Calcium-activated potassium channel BK alpha subunit domain-containing protein n=2 Tax=Aphanomyces astaci TaxID=112090 RepID=A0A397DBC3_APHAT|nr:hypothetical protein DYB25_002210 [Aphanomyces astaci]RHY41348.1 hypothetical protein DYB38_002892 [Aphanomyces astaci]RHY59674.1 hypothetical protein DYB30_003206 [Aphanomyces astaci]
MLGWGDKSMGFIRELCLANESEGGGVVVILSHRPKDELDMEIRTMVLLRGTKVICCTGNPLFAADLLKVSVHRARSITIMSTHPETSMSDDALVRVLLTLKSLVSHIVADVGQLDNKQFMRMIGGDILEALVSRHIVGRLVVLCSRSPHLGRVYNALLGFGGHEFYLNEWPECVGVPFGDLYTHFDSAIPIGLRTKYDPIAPRGDAIIVLAEDNDSYTALLHPVQIPWSDYHRSFQKQPLPPPPRRILLCGWRRDLHTILHLLQHLSQPGTVVDLVNPTDIDERLDTFRADGLDLDSLTNLNVAHIVGNSASKRQLTNVHVASYDCIMVVTDKDHEGEPMGSDSHILKSVMLLRSLELKQSRRVFHQVPCVAEVLDTRTQKTIAHNPLIDGTAEWIKSNDLVCYVSRMLAMISENRFVNAIFDDVLGDHGSTFDVLPASRYAESGEKINFWQLAQRASVQYDEIVCGYVYMTKAGHDVAPVVLNPRDKVTPRYWDNFCVVVLRDSAQRTTFTEKEALRWKIHVV